MFLNDSTMWHDCIYIHMYEYFYMMTYIWGFYLSFTGSHSRFYDDDYIATRPLWMDLCKDHIWLDWCYDVPPSWVVWLAFQPWRIWGVMGMPQCHCMAYPSQHQWSGLVYYICWFHYIKLICICFTCICIMI